jgi:hypothetical protein
MRVSATADIPAPLLAALVADLEPLGSVRVDGRRFYFKSIDPPSWVALLELPSTWIQILGPSAAIFLGELLKEAAKDTWRNKAAIARALALPVSAPLRAAAIALARFRGSAQARTSVDVGFPVPDEHFGTRLRLEGREPDTIALELALFVRQSGAIERILREAEESGDAPIGQVILRLQRDGAVEIIWAGGESLEEQVRRLPPPAP